MFENTYWYGQRYRGKRVKASSDQDSPGEYLLGKYGPIFVKNV